MERIRKRIIFYGSVQGVGFRYRAYYAANRFGISGYVKNRYDGAVEMEAEGTEADIDSLILAIEAGTFVRIENMEVERLPLKNDRNFVIR
ncbi:MAG: acylphosphatase [Ruminococcus sp.]|nr:acylphosphatase [Ruminococcus sp.]